MLQLALCEDEPIFSDMQTQVCRAILEKFEIGHNISVFTNSTDFITAFFDRRQRFDMILLDIVMDGVDGMELARRIRAADENAAIVFITSHDKYALQGYDVKALHYLMKPVDAQKLEGLILSVNERKHSSTALMVKAGGQQISIPVNEIIFVQTVKLKRCYEIVLADRKVVCSGKMADVLTKLPNGSFVRCHQGYAVNIRQIRTLSRQCVILAGGVKIPVSRTYLSDIKSAFLSRMAVG